MVDQQVINFVHSVIKKVWVDDISKDYTDLFILKEDTLKNAFYYHLRRRLGDDYLLEHNLRIFTEYKIASQQRIDLVIVEIDPEDETSDHLSDCVTGVIAVIEMKHKGRYVNESCFDKDVLKVLKYMDIMDDQTLFYLAFIREMDFYSDEVTHFLPEEYKTIAKGKITELLSYGLKEADENVWEVIEH